MNKQIKVKDTRICPPLALAPMVGLSHSAFRSLLVDLGGVGLFYSEMLDAKRLPHENCRYTPALIRDSSEWPLFYQIFTNEKLDLEAAVVKLEQLGAQGIDLNLGCPAPQLKKLGAGKFLFERPAALDQVLKNLRQHTSLPLSVKIRIGDKADKHRLLDTCMKLEQLGVDLITVHARLTDDKFCRRPRWEMLDLIPGRITIPIFANGGIFTVDDAKTCLERAGVDGLMIGRGAIKNLWLIRDIAREIYQCETPLADYSDEELYFLFIELVNKRFSVERQLGRLKQFTHLYAASLMFGHRLASMVQSSKTLQQATDRARMFFKLIE